MNRLLAGESLAALCREYEISRKTGDKFKQRFKRMGAVGLNDKSRAPIVIPHRTTPEVVELLTAERMRHPSWGPKKIKAALEARLEIRLPAPSTIGDILVRAGLVTKRRRRPSRNRRPTTLRVAKEPNDLWCIDYKGQFPLGDKTLCYPLTLTDQLSRYILGCESMPAICEDEAKDVCDDIFRQYGLPSAMRSDNGVPFSSTGLAGLSKLSVHWMRLGIELERIQPGNPQQNGRHERMHRTLKFETARPPRHNLLQQQESFDDFVQLFNELRPHEALEQKTPASVYRPSSKQYPATIPDLAYPEHDETAMVHKSGHLYFGGRRIFLSRPLGRQVVGLREQRDGRWLVSFMKLDLGHIVDGAFMELDPPVPVEDAQ